MKVIGFSRKYHQIKAWVSLIHKSAYSFLIFWFFLIERWVSMFPKKKHSEKFWKKLKFQTFFGIFFLLTLCFLRVPLQFCAIFRPHSTLKRVRPLPPKVNHWFIFRLGFSEILIFSIGILVKFSRVVEN
jgi:hypothetical protein